MEHIENQTQVKQPCVAADMPSFVPVVVGVTGHLDIEVDQFPQVEQAVRETLSDLKGEFGYALCVMLALADGADHLVAQVASDLGIRLIAVSPMALAQYRPTIKQVELFDRFWRCAALRLILPDTITDIPGTPADNEHRQYVQLGAYIAARAHILLALWEGYERHDPRGPEARPGGTEDVLRMRFDIHRSLTSRRNSRLFDHSGSPLDPPDNGPVIHIITPRKTSASLQNGASVWGQPAGARFLLRDWMGKPRIDLPDSTGVLASMSPAEQGQFNIIKHLNSAIGILPQSDPETLKRQIDVLGLGDAIVGKAGQLRYLGGLQAAVDTLAIAHQNPVPPSSESRTPRSKLFHFVRGWRENNLVRKLGARLWLTAIAPIFPAVIFEWYAHIGGGYLMLGGYLTLFALGVMLHILILNKRHNHLRQQEYRSFAESLRIQIYWGIAGLPFAVLDTFLKRRPGKAGRSEERRVGTEC